MCNNFKHSTSNSEYENWTWGQNSPVWTTRWKTANHGAACLCCHVDKLCLFFKVWKRGGGTERGGTLKEWEQSQLSAISSHFTHQKLHTRKKSATSEPPDWRGLQHTTHLSVPSWANPITSYTANGNDHLKWPRTPWVTATISFWGEQGIKLQQQMSNGQYSSERIYSLLTSLVPKAVIPGSLRSFLVIVNSDIDNSGSYSTDVHA